MQGKRRTNKIWQNGIDNAQPAIAVFSLPSELRSTKLIENCRGSVHSRTIVQSSFNFIEKLLFAAVALFYKLLHGRMKLKKGVDRKRRKIVCL